MISFLGDQSVKGDSAVSPTPLKSHYVRDISLVWEGGDRGSHQKQRQRARKKEQFLLLFHGREEAWSLEDSSTSPCTGLCSSHVAAERPLAQTWRQRAAMTKGGLENWTAHSLKQMGLTVLSRNRKKEVRLHACLQACTRSEEPALSTFIPAGCPMASSHATSPFLRYKQSFP